MKVHLYRSTRSTWCGLKTVQLIGHGGHVTNDPHAATCLTCIKADKAEQRKEDAAGA